MFHSAKLFFVAAAISFGLVVSKAFATPLF